MTDPNETLSPEVGGTITVTLPCGDGEVEIEGAKSPLTTNEIPACHQNGDKPIEF